MPHIDVATNATPEVALLLALARVDLATNERDALQATLERGIDWDRFVRSATRHGLVPFAHRHLQAFGIPSRAGRQLHDASARIARRNLMLAAELASVVRQFADSGLRVVPLKGPVLGEILYGSLAMRRINDLDLLCRREELPRALALLVARGYAIDYDVYDATPETFPTLSLRLKDIGLLSADGRCRIELHHGLIADRAGHGTGLDDISDDLEQVTCFGVPMWILRAELLLVYLAMHGAAHAWERLEWLCGLAALLRSGRVRDWEHVRARAIQLDAVGRLRAALQTVHAVLGAPVPGEWLTSTTSSRRAVSIVTSRILNDRDGPSEAEMLRYSLWTDDSVGARGRRLWELLSLPRAADIRVVKLPRALWPLYALLRPVRIALRTVRGNPGR